MKEIIFLCKKYIKIDKLVILKVNIHIHITINLQIKDSSQTTHGCYLQFLPARQAIIQLLIKHFYS